MPPFSTGAGTAGPLTPVAIAYDFDGTLAPGNMQEHAFLPKLGIASTRFWTMADELARRQQGDKVLAYMHLMLQEARRRSLPIRRSDWIEHGRDMQLFPGLPEWFERIAAIGEALGLSVQHYVISSGLREMIEGSAIFPFLAHVFASGFFYGEDGAAVGPAMAVNYTTKTQFLFRINKGALDVTDDDAVNAFMPAERRPVPFTNMVFVGDGLTDIPSFRLVREQGGFSFAVYPPGDETRRCRTEQLIAEGRVHAASPADYREGSDLDERVSSVLRLIAARKVVEARPAGKGRSAL